MKKLLACILVILLSSPYAFCADVGKVTYVEGRVDVAKGEGELAVPLRDGDGIAAGDAIRTKAGSKAEVRFDDGSMMRLAQNSRVEIKDYTLDNNKRKTATIKLDRGKVRTIIAKTANSAPFNILTPNAEGTVKGSDIFTFYQAGSSGMLVAEGNLALKSIALPEESLSIPAGSSAFVDIAGAASGPRPYLELEKKMHEQDTYVPPTAPKKAETAAIKGVFAKISGMVKVTPKGATTPRDANFSDILGEGDQIETGENGMAEIKFDNGCGLNLKPNTQIKITKLVIDPKTGEYQNLFESSKGKIKARIENLKGKSSFEIKTPTAICGARGTFMYIEITPAMTKAFFEGGNGYINNLISGAQTDIGMGDNGSADDQGNNSNPNPTSNEERDNWTAGWDSGNDTSGYSSDDSGANDNLGGGTGGNTNNGNDAGNGGTNGDNGNPDLYIPPEPNPNPLPMPAMSLTGAFSQAGRGEGDYAFGQYGLNPETGDYDVLFDSGSMTNCYLYGEGDLWNTPSMPFVVFGNYSNLENKRLWGIDNLSGETSDGARYQGVIGGIIDNEGNSIEGLLYAIYIRPTAGGYKVGYIKSAGMAGGLSQGNSFFTLAGNMSKYLDLPTPISPDMLDGAISSEQDYFRGNIGGDVSGTMYGDSRKFADSDWGLWKGGIGGEFNTTTPPKNNWNAVIGAKDEISASYWIVKVIGTNWTNGKLSGTAGGSALKYGASESFESCNLGVISGDTLGVYYGDGSWEGITAGVYSETPLAFGGETTHESGADYAIFGGTQSLWTGSPDILFMGKYQAQEAPTQGLWGIHTLGRTSDGAAIYGMSGGVKLNDVLKGLMYAIYIRPDPENEGQYLAGYIRSTNLSGNVYPGLGESGMFETAGAVTAVEKGWTTVSSEDLTAYMQPEHDVLNDRNAPIYRDQFSGKVGGDIIGTFGGENISINGGSYRDQMWSVWRTESTGTQEPQGAWHAIFGSSDEESGDKGYSIGHINGPAWSGNEFSGDVTGAEIWYSPSNFEISTIGSMTGQTLGTYANGTWSATNIGVTEEVSLTFGGEINITGDGFGYYDTVSKSIEMYHGSLSLLFGGTESLWTATPADPAQVTLIGEFANPDPDKYKLWGYNWVSGETADGAKYLGFLAGTNINNSLKGMSAFLYVRPDGDGYRAGYLRSNDISGNFYTDISMLYATGHYSSDLDVSTDVLPSQVFKDSLFIKETDTHDDDGIIGGDISGNSSVGGIKLVEPDGTSKPWSIWGISCGGTFTNTPADPNDWHAVIGGKSTDETTGDLTGYWLGDINGDSWSGDGSLSGSVNVTGIDDFTLGTGYHDFTTSEGNLLGFYETNPNTWQALGLGITTETPLTFGGESPASEFGYYDQVNNTETFPSGSLNYLFGGTGSLWDDTAQMTIIGEYTNDDSYKLWDNEDPLAGYTSDGARFYTGNHGYLCGIVGSDVKDSSKGLFYAFYIRENPDYNSEDPESSQYLAGYLKSTNISGNFYSSIDMFKLQGTITHFLDLSTTFSPDELENNLIKTDSKSYGSVSGSTFSGSTNSESYYIDGQNWGLWTGSSGGTYDSIPADGTMRVGGYSENEAEEINAYWIGESSGGTWQGDEISGTISGTSSGTTITTDNLETFNGDTIGTYEAGIEVNNWQALNVGAWTATALKFVSSVSYADSGEASLTGLFGSTDPSWASGSPVDFTFMGSCSVSDGEYHMWGTDLKSHNYHNGTNTTYDGGAYYGMFGGTLKDDMDGGLIAIYIKDGKAGILSGSIDDGAMYADIEMFKATGTLHAIEKASGIEMPEDLRSSLEELNLEADPQKEGGGGGWEAVSGGTISGGITRENSTVFNIPDQDWGIWGATITGVYTALATEPNSWRLGLGGKSFVTDTETVASCWLGTLDASVAGDSKLTGNFKGFFFSDAGDGYLKVAAISGDAAGYVDVDAGNGTWQAGAIGEWVEVTDLLEVGQIGFNMDQLQDFVSVPITEVYSNVLSGPGTGGITSATMNMNLYANSAAALNGIWTAIINGSYSNVTNPIGWGATVNNGTDNVTLTGTGWAGGQWSAGVSGAVGGYTITNGQAGGTYADGNFSGAGAGTWNN